MEVLAFSDSKAFFESAAPGKGCIINLLKELAILPMAIFCKFCKTFFRFAGLGFSLLFLGLTLGLSSGMRDLFVRRTVSLAKDLADWVIYPFAVITRPFRGFF